MVSITIVSIVIIIITITTILQYIQIWYNSLLECLYSLKVIQSEMALLKCKI